MPKNHSRMIKHAIGPTIQVEIPSQQTIELYDVRNLVTVHFGKLPIVIEYPKGCIRSGQDKDGNKWQRRMFCHYGFVPNTNGEDDEEVDVYLGEDLSEHVYIVTQLRQDTGEFDEYKCMVGFASLEDAKAMYLKHFPDDWRIGDFHESTLTDLKKSIHNLREMVKTLKPIATLHNLIRFLGEHSHRQGAAVLIKATKKRFYSKYRALDQSWADNQFSKVLVEHFGNHTRRDP